MNPAIPKYFSSMALQPLLDSHESLLDKTRIKLLYNGLLIVLTIMVVSLPNIVMQQLPMQIVRTSVIFILTLGLFLYLVRTGRYKRVSHWVIWMTLGNIFSNSFIIFQTVNLITFELIILVSFFAFFALGQFYGSLYTAIVSIPVILLIFYNEAFSAIIPFEPEQANDFARAFSTVSLLLLIIYVIWLYNSSFSSTITSLNAVVDQQKALNEKLEDAMKQAEESSEAKSSFLSVMSHEIRTPLNVVIGLSNILLTENPRKDQYDNLQTLKYSAENLLHILNDILNFNKLESGKSQPEKLPFDLDQLCQQIIKSFQKQGQLKGVQVHYEMEPKFHYMIMGDFTQLTQILNNLLSNALKFTEKGNIWLNVEPIIRNENEVQINFQVKDEGIGIAPEHLSQIFSPFTQSASYINRKYGGTGLGLAIVKKMLELQGSAITVESELEKGSTFFFTLKYNYLPSIKSSQIERKQADIEDIRFQGVKILMAEDTMLNVMVMTKFLNKWQVELAVAGDGQSALNMHLQENYDLILMDLQMPGVNGYVAAKNIRQLKDRKKANIPIIALTASEPSEVKNKVYEAGMNDLISKPFDPQQVIALFRKYIPHKVIA
ncbi:ATP-binding protein [Cytophagales bacterium LB-30]|uniref:histidine kinase n=1 Tax=Shiella aurantiaca TaxID=3058365 RepID=A0ABT8F4R8_9BACT|nr:ATP-binding protein [Shiella aurantiaca]MDN4165450.1 ATP-binding protein [Shiella aurantiaca]